MEYRVLIATLGAVLFMFCFSTGDVSALHSAVDWAGHPYLDPNGLPQLNLSTHRLTFTYDQQVEPYFDPS